MEKLEISRQLIHLCGFLFVIVAQFTGGPFVGFYAFLVAIVLFLYSEIIVRQQRRFHTIFDRMESAVRDTLTKFERKDVQRPFTGAIWFFFSFGIIFYFFPMQPVNIASVLGLILSLGDSLSTLIGLKFGRHKIIGSKTWEGSLSFLIIAFLVSLIFLNPIMALITAIISMIVELLPETGSLVKYKRRGLIDDNILIPIITGLLLLVLL